MKQVKNRGNPAGIVRLCARIKGARNMNTLKTTQFKHINIGSSFYCNGSICIKKSTRTAWIDQGKILWFYFGQDESVKTF